MSDTALDTMASEVRTGGGWIATAGILVTLAGLFMLLFPVTASVSVTLFTGWALVFVGAVGCVAAIADRAAGGMWTGLILGVLAIVAGVMLAFNPLHGTVTLTMLLVIWLLVDGTVGTILSLMTRESHWGWWLASSLLSLLLGILLLGSLPQSAGWVLGTYVGIVLLLRGMALTATGLALRSAAKSI